MVPERLGRELVRRNTKQSGANGVSEPFGERCLAKGANGPVDGGHEHVLSGGGPLVALRGMGVDQFDETKSARHVKKRNGGAEFRDMDLGGLRYLIFGLSDASDHSFDGTEINGLNDFGFAIDTPADACVVIRPAVDYFFSKARHIRSY